MLLALRLTVSAAMLAYLLTRLDIASLLPRRQASTLTWVVAGLLVTGVSVVLSTLRWQRVLIALELPARLRTLLGHYLAGLFVGNFLPSTIGGDVLRVTRLSAENGAPPPTFASVVLERLSGWIVLPLMTLTTMALHPTLLHKGTATRLAVALSVGTLVLLAGIVLVAAHPRLLGRHADNPGWLRFVGAVHLGVDRFRRHPAAAAGVLGAGFVYQLTVVIAAWTAARALGIDVGLTVLLAFFPAVAIAQVLPVTFSGLGVREGALVLFLHPFDVTQGQAIALGLLFYAMNLAVSLLGAPPFAVGARSKSVPAPS
jgi:uncharacterized membrane protein YbhN (UPF0104 family)